MTIQEYQILAKRTCNDLGSLEKNLEHMTLGIISEFGELADAYKKHLAYGKPLDMVNVAEEIADIVWYIANEATFKKYMLTNTAHIGWFHYNSFTENLSETLRICGADEYLRICGADEYSAGVKLECVKSFALSLGLSEADFYKALENNIEKLKVRYPEKFTTENALNRDLETERKALEK